MGHGAVSETVVKKPTQLQGFFMKKAPPPRKAEQSYSELRAHATTTTASSTAAAPIAAAALGAPDAASPLQPLPEEVQTPPAQADAMSDDGEAVPSRPAELLPPDHADGLTMTTAITRETQTAKTMRRCPGVLLNLPAPGNENYPFGLHSRLRLPFNPSLNTACDVVVHSHACKKEVLVACENDDEPPGPCAPCVSVSKETMLINIVERSHDGELHSGTCNTAYLTSSQAKARSDRHFARMRVMRFAVMKQKEKIERQCRQLDDFIRRHLLLSQHNLPRIRSFVAGMLKRGATSKVDNEYRPPLTYCTMTANSA